MVILLFLIPAILLLTLQTVLIRRCSRRLLVLLPLLVCLAGVTWVWLLYRGGLSPTSPSVADENRAFALLLIAPAVGALSGCIGAVIREFGLPFPLEVVEWLRNVMLSAILAVFFLWILDPVSVSLPWPNALTHTFYGAFIFAALLVCISRPKV